MLKLQEASKEACWIVDNIPPVAVRFSGTWPYLSTETVKPWSLGEIPFSIISFSIEQSLILGGISGQVDNFHKTKVHVEQPTSCTISKVCSTTMEQARIHQQRCARWACCHLSTTKLFGSTFRSRHHRKPLLQVGIIMSTWKPQTFDRSSRSQKPTTRHRNKHWKVWGWPCWFVKGSQAIKQNATWPWKVYLCWIVFALPQDLL